MSFSLYSRTGLNPRAGEDQGFGTSWPVAGAEVSDIEPVSGPVDEGVLARFEAVAGVWAGEELSSLTCRSVVGR